MKLKKKPKKILIITITLIIIAIVAISAVAIVKSVGHKEEKEIKVLKSIDEYGYKLKDNKDKTYKKLFGELETILREEKVSDEKYANKIAEMFIYDFYSLNNKTAKTDVGGVDFILPAGIENFLVNAEDTYYKYIESNMYGERKQILPLVNTITIESTTPTEYAYNGKKYQGFEIKINWTYTDEKFSDYQKQAKLTLVKEGIKYYIAEVQ